MVSRSARLAASNGWGLRTYVVAMHYSFLWWVPGYSWFAELEGSLLARRDFSQGHARLLGAGIAGANLLGLEECEVQEGPARDWLVGLVDDDGELPAEFPEPSGTALVRCADDAGNVSEFRIDIVEIGCIIDVPLEAVATGYNRRMKRFATAPG